MKIAIIRRQYSSVGGAELYTQRLVTALAGSGHDVHLFAEAWGDLPPGVSFHPISVSGSRQVRPRQFAEAVQRELRTAQYDSVFSLDRTLGQDVYRAGDGVHRVWLDRRKEFAPWWKRPFVGSGGFHRMMLALEAETFSPARTGRIIVNSEMVKREILAHFSYPAERIHLVRNGIDVARFRGGVRQETRQRLGIRDEEFLLLFAGSGWERKGLPFLLKALDALAGAAPAVKLLIVGKGRMPWLARSPAVTFAPPDLRLEDAYAAADLFTFVPIYEPSANVCAEALAAGLPVLTSAQNGASEIVVEGQTGSVISNPSDVGSIVRKIQYWLNLPTRVRVTPELDLTLERNVRETLEIIELSGHRIT